MFNLEEQKKRLEDKDFWKRDTGPLVVSYITVLFLFVWFGWRRQLRVRLETRATLNRDFCYSIHSIANSCRFLKFMNLEKIEDDWVSSVMLRLITKRNLSPARYKLEFQLTFASRLLTLSVGWSIGRSVCWLAFFPDYLQQLTFQNGALVLDRFLGRFVRFD